jgi:hypothetical protein
METAKVDIRKLQLLNDRINQCIDALNQVRLSVHGLSHSPATQGVPGMGYPFTQGGSVGLGYAPYGQMPISTQPFPGLSHTQAGSHGFAPIGMTSGLPYPQPFPPSPFQQQLTQSPWFAQAGQIPGLSHTGGLESPESYARPLWADPLLAARVAQTFPYVQFGVPPVVSI